MKTRVAFVLATMAVVAIHPAMPQFVFNSNDHSQRASSFDIDTETSKMDLSQRAQQLLDRIKSAIDRSDQVARLRTESPTRDVAALDSLLPSKHEQLPGQLPRLPGEDEYSPTINDVNQKPNIDRDMPGFEAEGESQTSMCLPKRKSLLVTLCNMKYFPGAINVIDSVRRVGKWEGDIGVIVTPDLPKCARALLAKSGAYVFDASKIWVGRPYGPYGDITTVHFAKFALFTSQMFRHWKQIVYVDSDMAARAELSSLSDLSSSPHPALFVRVSNPTVSLYREASNPSRLPQEFLQRFPDRSAVFSTRLFAINTERLPPPEAVAAEASDLIARFLADFNANFEQGLLQIMFYHSAGSLSNAWASRIFTHYYHDDLPWLPSHARFEAFLSIYRRATGGDTECWPESSRGPNPFA